MVYHGHADGELFDLEADPDEYVNLWDDPGQLDKKVRLMQTRFDALAFATDLGPELVTWF